MSARDPGASVKRAGGATQLTVELVVDSGDVERPGAVDQQAAHESYAARTHGSRVAQAVREAQDLVARDPDLLAADVRSGAPLGPRPLGLGEDRVKCACQAPAIADTGDLPRAGRQLAVARGDNTVRELAIQRRLMQRGECACPQCRRAPGGAPSVAVAVTER